jgi:hypothetical protein
MRRRTSITLRDGGVATGPLAATGVLFMLGD